MPSGQTESPLISAQGLTRIYTAGRRPVVGLADLDLVVDRGERLVLKGNSSTLLSLLGGLDRPTSGRLVVAGEPLHRADAGRLTGFRRHTVGWSFRPFTSCPP